MSDPQVKHRICRFFFSILIPTGVVLIESPIKEIKWLSR